jgi:hypothetical protein
MPKIRSQLPAMLPILSLVRGPAIRVQITRKQNSYRRTRKCDALFEAAKIFSSEKKNHTGRMKRLPAPVAHRIGKAPYENIARPQTFSPAPQGSQRILLKSKKFVKCKLQKANSAVSSKGKISRDAGWQGK